MSISASLVLKAIKNKVRFSTVGFPSLTLEDLFTLPMVNANGGSMDDLYKSLNRELKDTQEESIIITSKPKNTELQVKLELVTAIIEMRMAEKEANEKRVKKAAERKLLVEQLATAQEKEQGAKTADEIAELLAKHDEED